MDENKVPANIPQNLCSTLITNASEVPAMEGAIIKNKIVPCCLNHHITAALRIAEIMNKRT